MGAAFVIGTVLGVLIFGPPLSWLLVRRRHRCPSGYPFNWRLLVWPAWWVRWCWVRHEGIRSEEIRREIRDKIHVARLN